MTKSVARPIVYSRVYEQADGRTDRRKDKTETTEGPKIMTYMNDLQIFNCDHLRPAPGLRFKIVILLLPLLI